jgi:hypothetical protein
MRLDDNWTELGIILIKLIKNMILVRNNFHISLRFAIVLPCFAAMARLLALLLRNSARNYKPFRAYSCSLSALFCFA